MSLKYPRDQRMFEDRENSNERFYRESEAHARINISRENIREDFGFEKKIYEEEYDPNQYYQDLQSKLYRSQ